MNYEQPELRYMLAAEYALGTLTGRARERFARLLASSGELRRELDFWEERLSALGLELAPVDPPDRVWQRIRQQLGQQPGQQPTPSARPSQRRSVNFWRGAFAVAAAVAIALAATLWLLPVATQPPPQAARGEHPAKLYVSTINNKQDKPAWLVTTDPASGTMSIRALPGNVAPPSGKAFELWMIPANGKSPMAMSMLPATGVATGKVPKKVVKALSNAKGLAVSVEPPGGSPTGQPTGPVVFSAGIVANI